VGHLLVVAVVVEEMRRRVLVVVEVVMELDPKVLMHYLILDLVVVVLLNIQTQEVLVERVPLELLLSDTNN
jgi:hypothetical protein